MYLFFYVFAEVAHQQVRQMLVFPTNICESQAGMAPPHCWLPAWGYVAKHTSCHGQLAEMTWHGDVGRSPDDNGMGNDAPRVPEVYVTALHHSHC